MDGSDRKSNSFSSTSNKNRSSSNKGVDENGKSYQSNVKQTKTKHYMSPTISAASKFSHSKKEILAERNDSLDNLQNIPNLDSKCIGKAESLGPSRESSSESVESEAKSRPKFLPYKPSRGGKTEEKEGENDAVIPISILDSVGTIGQQRQLEGGGVDESDDEFEEVDDERGWGLKGALKLFILLLVLVLSTLYVNTMNSATPSPVVQALFCLRNGYQIVQDHVYEYVNQNSGLFRVVEDKRILDLEMEESSNELNEVVPENEAEEGVECGVIAELDVGEIQGLTNSEAADTVEKDKFMEGEQIVEEDEAALDSREISDLSNPEMFETVEVLVSVSEQIVGTPVTSVADALEKEVESAVVQESIKDEIFEEERVSIDSHNIGNESVSSMIKGLIKLMETECVLKAVIWLAVLLSSVIASVILFRNRRENHTLVPTPVVAEPCFETPIERAAKFVISKSVIHKEEDWNRSLSRESGAGPRIELLGELEVTEMKSTSLRINNSSRVIESEVSSHSVSIIQKTTISPVSSYPLDVQTPPSLHISTIHYPNDKKSVKKKASERVDDPVTTPLRRSSRLRNRVISP